jgi:hypothetical protein
MKFRLILIAQVALVAGLVVLIASGRMPLGIPGEWEWLRVKARPPFEALSLVALTVAGYAGFAALGARSLRRGNRGPGWLRESAWLLSLLAASIAMQVAIPLGAADEFDLTKWAYVNYFGASTGYYQVARREALQDPWRFLSEYPEWIQRQDSLHIGTHPPGLITLQCLLLRTMERNPGLTALLIRTMPSSTVEGFRQIERGKHTTVAKPDRAALYLASLITLLACAGTVVPLYALARSALSAETSWIAATLWPLVPSANLFQPDPDTAYPFLATLALALAAWSARVDSSERRLGAGLLLAFASGLVLAFAVVFTLAFLPVGLIVAVTILTAPGLPAWRRLDLIAAIGAGFILVTGLGWWITGASPLTIWFWNLRNHARFYVEYPRTYLAWLIVNPIELAIALGLPTALWSLLGFAGGRAVPRTAWATLGVLVLLDLIGRNMGEVARLWMLFLPPLLLAAAAGIERLAGGPRSLAATIALTGIQTLALQALIQVVYPVNG